MDDQDGVIYGRSMRRRGTNGHQHGVYDFDPLTMRQCAAMPPRPYLIKGLICAGDHAVMIGHPGSGKSVLGPHLALAIAHGRSVLGRRVHAGRVLYIAAEDGIGMAHRAHAHLQRYGDTDNFRCITVALDLLSEDSPDLAALVAYVGEFRPALIVIDTLARSFPGLRENESEDTGHVVRVIRDHLSGVCGSAVLGLAHIAKDGGSTPRGHGLLNGDADLVMILDGARCDSARTGPGRPMRPSPSTSSRWSWGRTRTATRSPRRSPRRWSCWRPICCRPGRRGCGTGRRCCCARFGS